MDTACTKIDCKYKIYSLHKNFVYQQHGYSMHKNRLQIFFLPPRLGAMYHACGYKPNIKNL